MTDTERKYMEIEVNRERRRERHKEREGERHI